MYTVEFYGNKGWEVGCETERQDKAIQYWKDCMMDGYNARITYEGDVKQ